MIGSVPVHAKTGGNGTLFMYSDASCSTLLPQQGGIQGYVLPSTGTPVYIKITGITEFSNGAISVLVQFTPYVQFLSGTVSGGTTNCIEWTVGTFGGALQTTPTGCSTGNVNYGPAGDTNVDDFYTTLSNGGTDGGHFYWGTGCGGTPVFAQPPSVTKTATGSYTTTYAWSIAKAVDQTRVNTAAGNSVTLTYTVTVTHDAGTVSGVTVAGTISVFNPNAGAMTADVTDQLSDGTICTVAGGSGATLAAGISTFGYSCSLAALPVGEIDNTATVTWADQTVSGGILAAGSASFTYTNVAFTNTVVDGCATVTDSLGGALGTVCYTDPSPTTFTYTNSVTAPAGTCTTVDNTATFVTSTTGTTGSDSKSVMVCGGLDLTVSKTASPSNDWTISKVSDQTRTDIASGGSATFHYTISVDSSGWTVSGTIRVVNPNDWESITANVADAVNNGGSCTVTGGTSVVVPAEGFATLPYSCTYSTYPASVSGTNTATATWDSSAFATPDGSATGTAGFTFPSVTVTDTAPDGTVTTLGTCDVTGPCTFSDSFTTSGVGGTCTSYTNSAEIVETGQSSSATVNVCVGLDLTVGKTATSTFTRTFSWGISKSVDNTEIDMAAGGTATFHYTVVVTHDSGTDSAWTVSGTITVTNPNDWESIGATLADALPGANCVVATGSLGDSASGFSLAAGASETFGYSCTFATQPAYNTGMTNTAMASVTSGITPDSTVTGSADFSFTNPTTLVDDSVTVTDTLGGVLGTVSYTDATPTTFTYSNSVTAPAGTCNTVDNTATFTTDTTGTTGSASQSAKVCGGVDLTVSKTANPAYTRTYAWSIFKSVSPNSVTQIGGTATFNYQVTVTETGFTDSGWMVSGTITVTNPNDWESITANVADAVNNGGSCTVTGGAGVVIAASSSVSLAYTCTYTSAPTPSAGVNTATATWDSSAYFTADSSATGTANFSFTTPTTLVNHTVTVTDTFNGVTTTLGTLTATDTTPYTTSTFSYSHVVNVPNDACITYSNTAQIVQTGQTASASAQVCSKVGALTMGYWQNKLGQGIISGGSSTGGVCNVATWLRQYAPFQDLSATATCSQTASYVYNIIKSANAGGATANAMLKGQMLATALDVYFSDPALGGNKIGAPAPVGSQLVILTNLGGTDVSSAFGGATSMTVSQMLSYAASQSNAGGSFWYGNVKSIQTLGIYAFNFINNST